MKKVAIPLKKWPQNIGCRKNDASEERPAGRSSAGWKQKSNWLSRYVRFVIAKHSPERGP